MLGAMHLLPDGQRSLMEWLRFSIPALGTVELGQVVEAHGYVRMLWTERLHQDSQRSLEVWLRIGIPALDIGVLPASQLDIPDVIR